MSASASLIPELEDVIQHGSVEKRAQTLQRIANLFIDSAPKFNEDHIRLFDDVLCRLVVEIESRRAPSVAAAWRRSRMRRSALMRRLAHDDDILVAGPVLAQSARLKDVDLVDIAKTKGQAHLFAISGREGIGESVTDVLVRRGDPEVVHSVAGNQSARLSDGGFSALVQRSQTDGVLAEKVGARPIFRRTCSAICWCGRPRWCSSGCWLRPGRRRRPRSGGCSTRSPGTSTSETTRDYSDALRTVLEMQQAGKLGEEELVEFAQDRKYEEMVAAISLLCDVPVEAADRLMGGDRPDPILILCKATAYGWPTARAIIMARPSAKGTSSHSLDAAFANFEKLAPATAQRVVRFWQVRDPDAVA